MGGDRRTAQGLVCRDNLPPAVGVLTVNPPDDRDEHRVLRVQAQNPCLHERLRAGVPRGQQLDQPLTRGDARRLGRQRDFPVGHTQRDRHVVQRAQEQGAEFRNHAKCLGPVQSLGQLLPQHDVPEMVCREQSVDADALVGPGSSEIRRLRELPARVAASAAEDLDHVRLLQLHGRAVIRARDAVVIGKFRTDPQEGVVDQGTQVDPLTQITHQLPVVVPHGFHSKAPAVAVKVCGITS